MSIRDFIGVALALFFWASNVLVQKLLVTELPICIVNLCRFGVLLPLLFFVKKPQGPLWPYLVTAFFWNALNFVFQGIGWKSGVQASVSAFLIQTNVFFSLLFSYVLLNRKIRFHQLAGMLITSSGIFYLVFSAKFAEINWTIGLFYLLLSAMSSGLGFTFVQKFHLKGNLQDVMWLNFFSFAIFLPVSFFDQGIEGLFHQIFHMEWGQWLGVGYGAFMGTVFASMIWVSLMGKHTPGTLMPFLLLLPAITTFFSKLFLNEELSNSESLGCFIMMVGVAITQSPALRLLGKYVNRRIYPFFRFFWNPR